jgi:hypothetical protein
VNAAGSHIRNRPLVRRSMGREPVGCAEPSPAETPYWLLWSTSIVAFVLGVAAFLLWGINGAATLFETMVALCT